MRRGDDGSVMVSEGRVRGPGFESAGEGEAERVSSSGAGGEASMFLQQLTWSRRTVKVGWLFC